MRRAAMRSIDCRPMFSNHAREVSVWIELEGVQRGYSLHGGVERFDQTIEQDEQVPGCGAVRRDQRWNDQAIGFAGMAQEAGGRARHGTIAEALRRVLNAKRVDGGRIGQVENTVQPQLDGEDLSRQVERAQGGVAVACDMPPELLLEQLRVAGENQGRLTRPVPLVFPRPSRETRVERSVGRANG